MKRYPRSFLQLVTYGYILVAIPFLVVTGYALFTLDSLSAQYRQAVEDVSNSARLGYELAEDLVHMEKDLRRYEILRDADSVADYETSSREWRTNLQAYASNPQLPENLLQEMAEEIALERAAFEIFSSQKDTRALYEAIESLKQRSVRVREEAGAILQAGQDEFRGRLAKLRQNLMIAVVVAIAVAAVCIWLGRCLLARLIGGFEQALMGLGQGQLKTPIALAGPSDLRWLGRWLEWLRKRLLSLESDRVLVLRHVSHELKTPLAAIHEGASLLAEEIPGPLSREQMRIVDILRSNTRRLKELIDGLLKLQMAEHGAERICFQTLQYDEVVAQVIETHRLIANERQIAVQALLEPLQIIAGREALQTIVHNLVSNAFKFSPDGGRILVKLSTHDNQAILEVIDAGPGVAEKDEKRIFEPFFRSSSARQVSGTGLGLAIVQEFVRVHHGEISFNNLPSGGAHFRVMLPLDAPYLRKSQYG